MRAAPRHGSFAGTPWPSWPGCSDYGIGFAATGAAISYAGRSQYSGEGFPAAATIPPPPPTQPVPARPSTEKRQEGEPRRVGYTLALVATSGIAPYTYSQAGMLLATAEKFVNRAPRGFFADELSAADRVHGPRAKTRPGRSALRWPRPAARIRRDGEGHARAHHDTR
jgi:hypothetical protein